MVAAEWTRPDVIQIAHALHCRARAEGMQLVSHIDDYLLELQTSTASKTLRLPKAQVLGSGTCDCVTHSKLDQGKQEQVGLSL